MRMGSGRRNWANDYDTLGWTESNCADCWKDVLSIEKFMDEDSPLPKCDFDGWGIESCRGNSVVGPPWRLTQHRSISFFLASLRR